MGGSRTLRRKNDACEKGSSGKPGTPFKHILRTRETDAYTRSYHATKGWRVVSKQGRT